MTVTYSPAPEVEAIAKRLIRDVDQHKMLDQIQIEYVFRSEAANENGKAVLGMEEFHSVVDRRGLWQRDIEVFVKVANHQMSLLAGEAS